MCAAFVANQRPTTVISESTREALVGLAVAAATAPAARVFWFNTLVWIRALAISNILGIPSLSIVAFMTTLRYCTPATTCADHPPTALAVMPLARLPVALSDAIAMFIFYAPTHTPGPSWVQFTLAPTNHEPLEGRHGGPPLQRQKSERKSEPCRE